MEKEHIVQSLQSIALNPEEYNNSRSPADTRVKSLETLAKIGGLIDKQGPVNFNFVQPILGGQSVRTQNKPVKQTKEIIDIDSSTEDSKNNDDLYGDSDKDSGLYGLDSDTHTTATRILDDDAVSD
jgi:hypothetical protein